ncbi:hypothetical protein CF319_g3827 [Tilletia indica]|nr:hypothetical protein CF319_g3827 [Tilletia indica]
MFSQSILHLLTLGTLLLLSNAAQSTASEIQLPLIFVQGLTAAPAPTSAGQIDKELTATVLGSEDRTTTYLLGCRAGERDGSCGLPGGAPLTVTAAPSQVNQSYVNRQLQITFSQQCILGSPSQEGDPLPRGAQCTMSFSGLPAPNAGETLTASVTDVANYYRTISVMDGDNTVAMSMTPIMAATTTESTTTTTTTTTTTSTSTTTTTTSITPIAPVISTADAVTSTSIVVLPAPPTATQLITVTPTMTGTIATGGAGLGFGGAGTSAVLLTAMASLFGALLL